MCPLKGQSLIGDPHHQAWHKPDIIPLSYSADYGTLYLTAAASLYILFLDAILVLCAVMYYISVVAPLCGLPFATSNFYQACTYRIEQ